VSRATPPASFDAGNAQTVAVGGALGSILSRWLSFAAYFLLIGVMTFRFFVLRRMSPTGNDLFAHVASTNSATLGIVASVGGLIGAVLKVARESADMPDMSVSSMMLNSVWGWSLLLQIIGLGMAGIALYLVHRPGDSQKKFWTAAFIGTAIAAMSPSFA
jgi:hypothetical protein